MTSSIADLPADSPRAQLGPLQRFCQRQVLNRLRQVRGGCMVLVDGPQRWVLGERVGDQGLDVRVEVKDPSFYTKVALGGILGASEAYVDGSWDSSDLTAVVQLFARNRQVMGRLEQGVAWTLRQFERLHHSFRSNTRGGSRRNIQAHYDLGNDLFESFLDPTMMYSCAIFETPETDLESAQRAKIARLCQKLQLTEHDHVLEIGTGWGGFSLQAVRDYGCRVTTTTISEEQYQEASRRVKAAGFEDRITILKTDYRDLEGSFDKLVSIEMIEAVGLDNLPTYFAACNRLLKPDGLFALQAITIADRNYEEAKKSVDFIQKYIFPGGSIPSVSAMTNAIAEATDLTPMHLEEIGLHYAETLRRWRISFEGGWDGLSHRYSDEFCRLWRYYFCYCEGGFLERVIGTVQIVLAGPEFRADTLRGQLGGGS